MTTPIIRHVVNSLLPILWVFSIYIMLFGHLSPGGGFSGGSLLGGTMILDRYVNKEKSFGSRLKDKCLKRIAVGAITLYTIIKGQSFLFGALHKNGLSLPLGVPGNIISSGLILPLNLIVGLLVAVGFYMIAVLFEEGRP